LAILLDAGGKTVELQASRRSERGLFEFARTRAARTENLQVAALLNSSGFDAVRRLLFPTAPSTLKCTGGRRCSSPGKG